MPSLPVGFFGKLPSAGDFVQRRLPSGFVDAWDRHFETAVAESRHALGDDWHAAYHASPVWRFLLAAGVCGESAWAGVMGPGVDRVGRCFPMVIAAPVAADAASCARVLTHGAGWFDAAEQVHVAAQADATIGVDLFDEQVARLVDPLEAVPSSAVDGLHGIDWSAASHWRLPLPSSTAGAPFLDQLWARLAATPGRWCLWWTRGAQRMPATVLATQGLPQPAAYAGLLDASHGVTPWRSLGTFDGVAVPQRERPDADASLIDTVTAVPAPPVAAWLPDDPELFSDLDTALVTMVPAAPSTTVDANAGVAVLQQPGGALTMVAAEIGCADPRQRAVAAVAAIGQELADAGLAGGMRALLARVMALNPRLCQASEDLIDPVLEDCAVIAAHLTGNQADLLRIGTAAAWHWRRGRLQPFFTNDGTPALADIGGAGDIDDLLFNRASPAAPGLGAAAQPTCGEVCCAVEPGDRLLLMATRQLLQLSPDILARSLALPSCEEARLSLGAAAGLGTDTARWPLAIIGIDA